MTEPWANFFVAETGAAAALTGLLFVAVSINLARILAFPGLPGLAFQTLAAFVSVLCISTLGLVPQSAACFGWEVGAVGVLTALSQLVVFIGRFRTARQYGGFFFGNAFSLSPQVCFLIAGLCLAHGHADGIYWVVPGTLLAFGAGLYGAWVLLIEILR